MKSYLTRNGYNSIKLEIEKLEKELIDVIEKISRARELGDFSENAELQSGKQAKDFIECRISYLRKILMQSNIIKKDDINDFSKIQIGANITMQNLENDDENMQISIAGDFESDPIKGIISYKAPIASQLIGKSVGDVVNIKNKKYKIMKIDWSF